MTDAEISPTPNDCDLPRRRSDFATFNEAIDYAARSAKGLNFHDMRGTLECSYPYVQMREDAIQKAFSKKIPFSEVNALSTLLLDEDETPTPVVAPEENTVTI